MKLGPRHNHHKGRAAIRHYANQPARPFSVITNLRMELFEALVTGAGAPGVTIATFLLPTKPFPRIELLQVTE